VVTVPASSEAPCPDFLGVTVRETWAVEPVVTHLSNASESE
jgi:hypothetical protein